MAAMEAVATHLDEPTGYFVNHWQLLERIERAEQAASTSASPPLPRTRSRMPRRARRGRRRRRRRRPRSCSISIRRSPRSSPTRRPSSSTRPSSALSDWRAQPGSAGLAPRAQAAAAHPQGRRAHGRHHAHGRLEPRARVARHAGRQRHADRGRGAVRCDPGEPRRARADARAGRHRPARGARRAR